MKIGWSDLAWFPKQRYYSFAKTWVHHVDAVVKPGVMLHNFASFLRLGAYFSVFLLRSSVLNVPEKSGISGIFMISKFTVECSLR